MTPPAETPTRTHRPQEPFTSPSPRRLTRVPLAFFSQVHYLSDSERGTVWEETIIYCPKDIQMLALSATVGNPGDLQGWISRVHGPTEVVTSNWRPVPLTFYYARRPMRDGDLPEWCAAFPIMLGAAEFAPPADARLALRTGVAEDFCIEWRLWASYLRPLSQPLTPLCSPQDVAHRAASQQAPRRAELRAHPAQRRPRELSRDEPEPPLLDALPAGSDRRTEGAHLPRSCSIHSRVSVSSFFCVAFRAFSPLHCSLWQALPDVK